MASQKKFTSNPNNKGIIIIFIIIVILAIIYLYFGISNTVEKSREEPEKQIRDDVDQSEVLDESEELRGKVKPETPS